MWLNLVIWGWSYPKAASLTRANDDDLASHQESSFSINESQTFEVLSIVLSEASKPTKITLR